MERENKFKLERHELELIESAVDRLRDAQFIHARYLQKLLAETPKEVPHKKYQKHLENNVQEWDRQMTYYYLLCEISDKFSKYKSFDAVEIKPIEEG